LLQLEGAKLKEQLDHQAPLLANIIGAEESLEAVSTTLRRRKAGPKAANPLSQRRKKDLPPTGRLSKKELAAQQSAHAAQDRGKKRARDEVEAGSATEDREEPPQRSVADSIPTAADAPPATKQPIVEDTVQAVGGENEGAQKKRKRKRRKKGTEDGPDGDKDGDASD
jgi:hypothetical protein